MATYKTIWQTNQPADTGQGHDTQHARHLSRALELAVGGQGRVSPNPLAGAVVVKDRRVIGEGFHAGPGEEHAERAALGAVTEDPRGATLYINLEPCCHHGRTPPCTEAILQAGIGRVVFCCEDPTPKASGQGPAVLRQAGVEVIQIGGEVAHAARAINQPFLKHAKTALPLVIAKFAQSLDGKVATSSGDSQWISNEQSRERTHRWRADADAVCTGIGTALADDPELTARIDASFVQPLRIVFDATARLPLSSRLVSTASDHPVLVFASENARRDAVLALRHRGVEVIVLAGETEGARVSAALAELGRREVQSLVVEGGPHLVGAFFDAGAIDEVRAFIAPLVIGGYNARSAIEGFGAQTLELAKRALTTTVERIEDDVLVCARFSQW